MRYSLYLALAAVLAGCTTGGSNSVTGPQNNGNGSGQNGGSVSAAITATVNGAAWASSALVNTSYIANNQQLTFIGSNAETEVMVSVARILGTGTYSVSYNNVNGSSAIVSNVTQGWNTYLPGGTGSVNITTWTAHHAVGTFAFTAVPAVKGTAGNMPVINGKFDVTF